MPAAPSPPETSPAVPAALPAVRTEVQAQRPGVPAAPGPTVVLPKVDVRPTGSPHRPQALLAEPRDTPHRGVAIAQGDVLPPGAATILMPSWSPPAAAPEPDPWGDDTVDLAAGEGPTATGSIASPTTSSPPVASAAPATIVMPVAAIPARPTSEEGVVIADAPATIVMPSVDVDVDPAKR
jgi:hypothetical protein